MPRGSRVVPDRDLAVRAQHRHVGFKLDTQNDWDLLQEAKVS